MSDVIDVIETAYRADLDQEQWMSEINRRARPLLDTGAGIFVSLYDLSKPGRLIAHSMIGEGIPLPGWQKMMEIGARQLGPHHVERLFAEPCGTMSQRLGESWFKRNPIARALALLGYHDLLGINVADPSGHGAVIAIPMRARRAIGPDFIDMWSRVGTHVAAGLRLRRRLAAPPQAKDQPDTLQNAKSPLDRAEAILDTDGRVEHAVGDAESAEARAALRGAATAIDRVRGRLRRNDGREAVALWRVLVDAQWSVVDHYDTDGRRYIIAQRNQAEVQGLDRLTPRERQIVAHAALGHANKLIAYELGVAESTVATHLARAAAKLGVTSRVELVSQVAIWKRGGVDAAASPRSECA